METLTEETVSSRPSEPQLITSANTPRKHTLENKDNDYLSHHYIHFIHVTNI